MPARSRLPLYVATSLLILIVSITLSLFVGYRHFGIGGLIHDPLSRAVFQLRLPRVILAGIIGATLAAVGTALQALFRNPLAEPFTLGVSGGSAVGASVAIALGWGAQAAGIPLVFLAAFAGASLSIGVVFLLATKRSRTVPGSLLLSGIVVNVIANAAVLTIQYVTDQTHALQILRWLIGSLDVVGFGVIWKMLPFLVPGWAILLFLARDLYLLAIDEETAAALGVRVRRCETVVYLVSALIVAVTVSVGGAISFVGLIVPHMVRMAVGQDIRVVLPCSLILGAAFLMLADAGARTLLGQGELPVGAVTGLLGGPVFLWLMRREQRYSAL